MDPTTATTTTRNPKYCFHGSCYTLFSFFFIPRRVRIRLLVFTRKKGSIFFLPFFLSAQWGWLWVMEWITTPGWWQGMRAKRFGAKSSPFSSKRRVFLHFEAVSVCHYSVGLERARARWLLVILLARLGSSRAALIAIPWHFVCFILVVLLLFICISHPCHRIGIENVLTIISMGYYVLTVVCGDGDGGVVALLMSISKEIHWSTRVGNFCRCLIYDGWIQRKHTNHALSSPNWSIVVLLAFY